MEGELLTFPEYLCSPTFQWVIVAQSLDFCVVFVPFLFAIVLSVILRFITSDYLVLYNIPFFHANSILYQKQLSKNIKPEMRCNTVFANYKFEQLKQHLSSSLIFSYRPVSNLIFFVSKNKKLARVKHIPPKKLS